MTAIWELRQYLATLDRRASQDIRQLYPLRDRQSQMR